MRKAVFGILPNREHTNRVVKALKLAGFTNADISLLFESKSGADRSMDEQTVEPRSGPATETETAPGSAGGLSWLGELGASDIAGVGSYTVAGPIRTAIVTGASVDAPTAGIVGALLGMGVPEFEAKRYEERVKAGNILISIHAEDTDERDKARGILVLGGGEDIAYTSEASKIEGRPEHYFAH